MKTLVLLLVLVLSRVATFAQQPPPREEWYRGLEFEEAAGRAELIVVARVEEVTEIRIVHGGKGESATQQFRFKPLRVMKGVFARPELILGSSDLGGYRIAGALKMIKAGQTRLLFLGRSDVGYRNSNERDSLDHSLPPLADENDPLLQSVSVLLGVRAEPDRFRRVALLTDALAKTSGPAAVPLLAAITPRWLLAAQMPAVAPAVMRHLGHSSPAVRIAAAAALTDILGGDYLENAALRQQVADAIIAALNDAGPNIGARVALLGPVDKLRGVNAAQLEALLDFEKPGQTIAERNARIATVGRLRLTIFAGKLLARLQSLPLDAPDYGQIETALASIDPVLGAVEIERIAREKIASGGNCGAEIGAAGALPRADAVAMLVRFSALPLNEYERRVFAAVAHSLAESAPDDRLVAPLAALLAPDDGGTRETALEALFRIGSPAAARALQPRIAQEQNLHTKLRIAELLGKHGMRDGYPYAIEHASEPHLTEQAVAALVAMRDPRALDEAKKILETSNDTTWNRAAIRILGALGAKEFAPKFTALVADWKNPLAPSALIALADLSDAAVLPKIDEALAARNDIIVIAGAAAARRLLAHADIKAPATRDHLAAILADSSASDQTRRAALDALLALDDPRLNGAIITAASDANLEGTDLLTQIERLLRERKIKLPQ
jgi:HEAT repeat protein